METTRLHRVIWGNIGFVGQYRMYIGDRVGRRSETVARLYSQNRTMGFLWQHPLTAEPCNSCESHPEGLLVCSRT